MNCNVDTRELEHKVKAMYVRVAEDPSADFHFEMGREMAQRLGYEPAYLDRVPSAAVDSFAGVGHHFDLAALRPGERVVDLGSGSGMDSFVAALYVGQRGAVVGVDMTDAQRDKASALRDRAGFSNVRFLPGYIEQLPLADGVFDCAVSNGVVNLSADKLGTFREAARVLRPGGRLALSDIVTETPLPGGVVEDTTLWAACIGGAVQKSVYCDLIEEAGLRIQYVRFNPDYRFLSGRAAAASCRYGVRSLSLVAVKP